MRTRYLVTALVAVLATALALVTTAAGDRGHRGHHQKGLHAHLTGAAEVPGPGDPDGKGRAAIKLLPRFGAVCWRIETTDIAAATAAHIHRGAKGVAGPIVVDLFGAAGPRARGCVENVDENLIKEIARTPRGFYVNVHTGDFPNGAIRGQLHRGHRHRGQGKSIDARRR